MVVNRKPTPGGPLSSDAASAVRPFVAKLHDLEVSFRFALDVETQAPVFRMREEMFRASQSYLLGRGGHRHIAADRHDLSAYIFSCSIGDNVVASVRWVMLDEGEYSLPKLVDPEVVNELDHDRCLEAGRMIVDPSFRGRQIFEVTMYFSCLWLLRNTSYTSFGSVCLPKLARYYENIGLRCLSANPFAILGREGNQYVVVHGRLQRSLDILAQHLIQRGWSLSHAPAVEDVPPRVMATPVCEDALRLSGEALALPTFAFLFARFRRVLYCSHVGVWSPALEERVAEILQGSLVDDIIFARVSPSEWADVQRLSRTLSGTRIYVPAVRAMMAIENARPVHRSAEPNPVPGVPDLATCIQRTSAGDVILLYDARWRSLFGLEASTDVPTLPRDTRIVGTGGLSTYPVLAAVRQMNSMYAGQISRSYRLPVSYQGSTERERNMTTFLEGLDEAQRAKWAEIHQGPFWTHLRTHGLDRGLYVRLMTEIFHYTRHNSQNQALAALKVMSDRVKLLRYCLHHAYEEAGHDLMVLSDLASIGVPTEIVLASQPLPETQAFIAYLYRIAAEGDATTRLGYSYWAEGAYPFIEDLTGAMRCDLKLNDNQMTFFVEHSTIDTAHLGAVKKTIAEFCTTPELEKAALACLETSLHLTGQIFDASYREYCRDIAGQRQPVNDPVALGRTDTLIGASMS